MQVCQGRVDLRLLAYLLTPAIAGLLLAIFVVYHDFEIPVPSGLLLFGAALLAAAATATFIRLRHQVNEMRQLHRSHVQTESERDARESYLLGLATLAAETAHEISTPLSTMSVLIGELRHGTEPPPNWKETIDTLWSQMRICRRFLTTMPRVADVERLGYSTAVARVHWQMPDHDKGPRLRQWRRGGNRTGRARAFRRRSAYPGVAGRGNTRGSRTAIVSNEHGETE